MPNKRAPSPPPRRTHPALTRAKERRAVSVPKQRAESRSAESKWAHSGQSGDHTSKPAKGEPIQAQESSSSKDSLAPQCEQFEAVWEHRRLVEENKILKSELEYIRGQLSHALDKKTSLEAQLRGTKQEVRQIQVDLTCNKEEWSKAAARHEAEMCAQTERCAEVMAKTKIRIVL